MKDNLGTCFNVYPTDTMKRFDACVKPILLYASDFWGILKMPSNNPIETLFMSFCKQLLGVQKQSVNDGVLLELGKFPLLIHARKRAIKNWVRMATNTNCNKIVHESYQYSAFGNRSYAMLFQQRTKCTLKSI